MVNRDNVNAKSREYYWSNQTYREKKKQKMREYMMNRRIKHGVWGDIFQIIKLMRYS